MTSRTLRYGLPVVAVALLIAGLVAGSTRDGGGTPRPVGGERLVAFTSCAQLAASLRAATASPGRYPAAGGAPIAAYGSAAIADGPPAAAGQPAAAVGESARGGNAPDHSVTTTNQAGIDEPDIVKTDGRWIVSVGGGVLRVVDTTGRRLTGTLDLGAAGFGWPADLLMSGDHVLVLGSGPSTTGGPVTGGAVTGGPVTTGPGRTPGDLTGPGIELSLVDIAGGQPRLLADYAMAGTLIDARQDAATVRVVVGSTPAAYPGYGAPAGPAAAAGGVTDLLPRYRSRADGVSRTGVVPCASVSRPVPAGPVATGSATLMPYPDRSLVTLLTFDVTGTALGTGDPVSVVAGGQVVYATGTSLYLAGTTWTPQAGDPASGPATTVYQFDTSGTGRPRYVASGVVPGTLLNQYALSEWRGYLRVATTTQPLVRLPAGAPGRGVDDGTLGAPQGVLREAVPPAADATASGVYVLRRTGGSLVLVGRVLGLGRGERVYAVRFAGPIGYVVTFRQTDPLYAMDLADPRRPRVAGQLELTGYSTFLREVGGDRLIGIGQQVDASGETSGTQVSLFGVRDPARPALLARYRMPSGYSAAEADPHAFLYWAPGGTLVVPVTGLGTVSPGRPGAGLAGQGSAGTGTGAAGTASGLAGTGTGAAGPGTVVTGGGDPVAPVAGGTALVIAPQTVAAVFRVGDAGLALRGLLVHPGGASIQRSLVAGDTLWTLSSAGLLASDLTTLRPLAWIAF